jgi:very-short-patch-repair endonuclease
MRQFAKELRINLTEAERLLWRHLRSRRLEGDKFRRQQVIGPYIVDFVCFQRRLIIELDGGQHAENISYDHRRTLFLEAAGFKVMRFWNNEVLGNTDSVLESIRAACSITLTPTLSHQGRGSHNALRKAHNRLTNNYSPSPLAGEG